MQDNKLLLLLITTTLTCTYKLTETDTFMEAYTLVVVDL